MKIKYILKNDIFSRDAANLCFQLSYAENVRIIKGESCFNGKSLLGILSNRLIKGDIITVIIDRDSDAEITRNAFIELGDEIK